MGGQIINLGGHFVSKDSGRLNFVGLQTGGGAPLPPPKPGSKGAGGTRGASGAGSAGGVGVGEKGGKGEGSSEWSPLKGLSNFFFFWPFVVQFCFMYRRPFLQKKFLKCINKVCLHLEKYI